MEYSLVCRALPYREDQVAKLAAKMSEVGFNPDFPIVLWNGDILDGRHRYEAAELAGVTPVYKEFEGTPEEAWGYVADTNVELIRHLTSTEKEYFYVQRGNVLGVRSQGERDRGPNTQNCVSVPSQSDHAEALGVHLNTVNNWERDRKEIMSDPKLSEKASTPEGYREAKKEVKQRRELTAQEKKAAEIVPRHFTSSLIALAADYNKRWLQDEKKPEDMASQLLANLDSGSTAEYVSKNYEALQNLADLLNLALDVPRERGNLTLVQ